MRAWFETEVQMQCVRIRTSEKSLKKRAAKPNFDHCTIFDENLVAVNMKKTKLVSHNSPGCGRNYAFSKNGEESKRCKGEKIQFIKVDSS